MTWLKLDTMTPSHDDLVDLDAAVKWFYIAALCYSAQHLTDGHLRRTRIGLIDPVYPDPHAAIAVLEHAGLVEPTADGWQIRNYLQHQRSAEQVRAQREAAKERAQRVREVRANVRANTDRTHAVTNSARPQIVREQSREEKIGGYYPNIPSHPQVIHRCPDCDHVITEFGCDCNAKP